jgi:hypothetical protein
LPCTSSGRGRTRYQPGVLCNTPTIPGGLWYVCEIIRQQFTYTLQGSLCRCFTRSPLPRHKASRDVHPGFLVPPYDTRFHNTLHNPRRVEIRCAGSPPARVCGAPFRTQCEALFARSGPRCGCPPSNAARRAVCTDTHCAHVRGANPQRALDQTYVQGSLGTLPWCLLTDR